MTLILDSGGVTALAGHPARMTALRRQGQWPPQVPTVVLTEALTGDHRRDFRANQLLRMCQIRPVSEELARTAAGLRTATGRAASISATDAVVAALAVGYPEPVVLTSDPEDLNALVAGHDRRVTVSRV